MHIRSALLAALLLACTVPSSEVESTGGAQTKKRGHTSAPDGAPQGSTAKDFEPPFDSSGVDAFFESELAASGAPGLSVALVKGGRVRWAKGYGFANLETQTPATENTVYMLASISKTVVATALMQLVSDPKRGLGLDTDIDGSLPFPVRHPRFPDVPITFRMVLTHTAGFYDAEHVLEVTNADSTMPLAEVVGRDVARVDAWKETAPGTAYEYSNYGFALAGLLVESISGRDLESYTQANVFRPLGMNETSWFSANLDEGHMAMPYELQQGSFVPQGHYSWPAYPCGHLQTSAVQLAHFLAMFMRGGELGGQRVLAKATVDAMTAEQIPSLDPNQGLAWYFEQQKKAVFGHSGGFHGVSTDMWFDPETNAGYVLLTNGGAYINTSTLNATGQPSTASEIAAMGALHDKLLDLAIALPQ